MHPENQPGSLVERLFRLRKAAGLTGDQLGERLGWQYGKSKVSKIESGKQLPSADEVRAWAEAAGHPEQTAELLDLLASMQITHTRWRQRLKAGHTPVQSDFDRRTREAARFRNAELVLIPGLLQTAGYARSIVTQISAVYGTRDVDAAVQARMQRQEVLYDSSKTFEFVMSEAALRSFPCPRQVMAGQLDRLLSLDLPNVTLGIIPFGEVALMPFNSFYMLDDEATVETWDGKYQERDEIYARIFTMLMDEALTGDEARRLITAAAASLRKTLARTSAPVLRPRSVGPGLVVDLGFYHG